MISLIWTLSAHTRYFLRHNMPPIGCSTRSVTDAA